MFAMLVPQFGGGGVRVAARRFRDRQLRPRETRHHVDESVLVRQLDNHAAMDGGQ